MFNFFELALVKSLDEVDGGKTKQKREANLIYMNDEAQGQPDIQGNYDIETTANDVEVPMKGGSSAFSIHANKVYILYPSMFQDPNIFGRFSIPQNINLDPVSEKQSKRTSSVPQSEPPVIMRPNVNPNQFARSFESDPYHPYQANRGQRIFKRQAENENPPPPPAPPLNDDNANGKRNVETHLTGTIVVLNQDVNEINRKDAY